MLMIITGRMAWTMKNAEDDDSFDDVNEMTKQRQEAGDQEVRWMGFWWMGRKVNSIGRINSINSNACHCPLPAWLLAYKLCGQATTAAPPPDKTLLIIGLEGGGMLLVSHGHHWGGGRRQLRANANLKLYAFSAAVERFAVQKKTCWRQRFSRLCFMLSLIEVSGRHLEQSQYLAFTKCKQKWCFSHFSLCKSFL